MLDINVLKAEHSTSVTQMNMQPTPLFKMQTKHGQIVLQHVCLKPYMLQPVVSTK